ncbi:MAG: tetratricopeptide repeat protein [Ferruginibacter sp.]
MNKNIFCLFIIASALIISCSNNSKEAKADAAMPAQEKELRELIAKYPDSALLKENLVQYFRDNSNYSQAIEETDKILQKDSLSEKAWYMKAMLHSENDDTTQAINAWEKLVHINPNPEYIMSLGSMYATAKNPLALGMASLLMSNPQTRYQALFIQGFYYNNAGDKERAIPFFDQCIAIDYTNMLAYREKAIAEYDAGKYLDALKTLELAVTVKQTYDEAYYWMGRCYEKLQQKEQAVKSYQLALQFNAGNIEAKDALAKMGVVQ